MDRGRDKRDHEPGDARNRAASTEGGTTDLKASASELKEHANDSTRGECETADLEGQELMIRVSKDEPGSFESLVTTFQKPVLRTVYRYTGDAVLAEDLSQDVFLRIYKARKRYRPLAKFETWLHRIVFNVVVNNAQYRKRRKTVSLDAMKDRAFKNGGRGDADPPDPTDSRPLTRLETEELHRMVRDTVLDLPSNQRMVLVLNKYQDMSYQDIAKTLDTTVEAVKSMLFRAREKVRAKLSNYVKSEVCDGMEL